MSCRASPSPPNTRVPSRQGHSSWWARSLWLPLSCSGDTAESQWHPTAAAAFWTCWIPLPRWSPAFCYMEWPRLPMSPWLQCSTCLPMACTGAPGCCNPLAGTGQGVLSGGSRGESQASRSSAASQHPGTRHIGRGSWRTEEIRAMKPQGQMMLSAPGNSPRAGATPMPAPWDAAPPGTLCHRSHPPISHPRQCWGVQQLEQVGDPTPHSNLPPPGPRAPLLPPLQLHPHSDQALAQRPRLQEQQQLLLGSPQGLQPLPEQEPCPGPAPSCAPTQPPGGVQARRENKTLSSTLRFTQLTQKRSPAAPHKSTGCPS